MILIYLILTAQYGASLEQLTIGKSQNTLNLFSFYSDSDQRFNFFVPSTILGANSNIEFKSNILFFFILFINSRPLKSVKLNLAIIRSFENPKSDPGNKATPVSSRTLSHISSAVENFSVKNRRDFCMGTDPDFYRHGIFT